MMTTALEPGEIVVGVVFRIPQAAAYGRIRNPVSGFPMAGVMVARFPEGHRVGVTGVGSDGAFRWPEVERRLDRGEGIEAAGAALPAGTEVLVDQQAGRDFRCHLLRLAAGRAIARLD
jgi:carbon-monoxide dehydrogenase medium subunit